MSDLHVVRGDSICDRLRALAVSLSTLAAAGERRAVEVQITASDVLGFIAVFSCADVDPELQAFQCDELAAWWRSLSANLIEMGRHLRAGATFRDMTIGITIPREDCAPLSSSIGAIAERLAARLGAGQPAMVVP